MMTVYVGVRELRENLADWLGRVKDGEEIVVTERGKPVAQLTPLDASRSRLDELIRQGRVRPPLRPKRLRFDISNLPRMTPGPTIAEILLEMRREGC